MPPSPTASAAQPEASLPGLLLRAGQACPDAVALAVDGGATLTYAGWDRRSSVQAAGLRRAGIRPGDAVALVFDPAGWSEYAVSYLAVLKAAGVAMPLDAGLPAAELGSILRGRRPSAVLATDPGALATPVAAIDPRGLEEGTGASPEVPSHDPSAVAEILHVSRPLGPATTVPRSHRSLLGAPSLAQGCPALLHAYPVGTVAGQDALCASLRAPPLRVLVMPAFEPERLCALLGAGEAPAVSLRPSTARALLDSGAAARHDLSRVSELVLASGRVSPDLLVDLGAAFPEAELHLVDVLSSPRDVRYACADVPSETPEAETAETVTAVLRRVLDRREFGPQDDFFELGGTQLAATTVLSLIEDAFEVRVPLSAFLGDPTVAGLSATVDRLRDAGRTPQTDAAVAFSQEGMLWHECFAPGSQNLPGLARRFRGPLDVGALRRALDEIVRRHAALRTTFALRDGRPVQIVHPHRPLELPVSDLSALPAPEREAELERLVAEAGRRPFDLAAGPLFDPALKRLADDDHVLVIRTHHAIFDDWSVGVFRRELAALYAANAEGAASPLPDLPLQFADFSRRQRRRLAGAAGARQLSFWRRELRGAPLSTQLAVDDPSRPEGSAQPAGEPVSLDLPPELREALQRLARSERATLFMAVLTAFGALVNRYTGQDDLLLATVVANRNRTELEGLIGCFTKKVPLRLRLAGDPSFKDALGRTREALLGALTNQDLPFEAVVQDVLGPAATRHGVVPQVVLMFQGVTPEQTLTLPEVQTSGLETSVCARRAHFMAAGEGADAGIPWGAGLYLGTFVIVSLTEADRALTLVVRGAFHAPAVAELLARFRALLAGAVAEPERRVSELPLLDPRARAEVLRRGRGEPSPPPPGTPIDAFAAQVRRTPDAPAVDALTFAELDARADGLAARLQAAGARPGARVGIALEPSAELVVAALAVWKAGAAWVGIAVSEPEARLSWIVREAGLEIAVGDPAWAALAGRVRIVAAGGGSGAPAPVARAVDDAALVFYGSGPSAVERGVVLGGGAVLNLLCGLRRELLGEPGSRRILLSAGPADDGFLRQLVGLLDGHRLCTAHRRDPAALLREGRIDLVDCTPQELEDLLESGLEEALRGAPDRAVAPVLAVGTRTALGPDLERSLRSLEEVRAHVIHGPPECAFGATARAVRSIPRGVGRALAGVESHVLDRHGEPVPPRAIGELHLGGASLSQGYLGHPQATRAQFVERVLDGSDARFHRTGQLARTLPDGGVELLGPLDGAGELRGFRIDLERIRAALLACPGVAEATVAVEPDARGEPCVVAHVVPNNGEAPDATRLRELLWSRLPGYAWPAQIRVVTSREAAPGNAAARADAPPRVGFEQSVLSSAWAEALGIEKVSAEENFWQAFSFLEALARLRDGGVSVPGEVVTRNRAIGTLAAALAARLRRRAG